MVETAVREKYRLEALCSYEIMDTREELEFDNLVKLAAHICDVPFAKMNFVDSKRTWSKANYGNDLKEIPREKSFCYHTIQYDSYMMVEDALEDDRFREFDYVMEAPKVRFYAGFNIKGRGENIGTLCVFAQEPRQMTEAQLSALSILVNEVESRLELRKKNKDLATLMAFLEASVELMLIVEPATMSVANVNQNGSTLFKKLFGDNWQCPLDKLFPEWEYLEILREWKKNGAEQPFKFETCLESRTGEMVYLEINTIKKYDKWMITFQDITKRKTAEENLKREKKFSDGIVNSLPIDFYMFDEHLNLLRWNEKMTQTTGYTNEEIVELNPLDFFRGKDVERIKKHLKKTFNGFQGSIEANLIKKDGTSEPFLFNTVALENDNCKYLLGTGESIARQKHYQYELEGMVKEKEVLLGEVHHRVKNNLAVISGFLQLEELISEDEKVKAVLLANHMRVKSMALIHEELYAAKNFTGLDFKHYLEKLMVILEDKVSPSNKKIDLIVDVEPVFLNLNQAVPLALIVNELVSNAYEFAFEGRDSGSVLVELKMAGERINLRIKDDGIGLPEGFVLEESPTLGATLVLSYSEQINSDIDIKTGQGTEYELSFLNKKTHKGSSANAAV